MVVDYVLEDFIARRTRDFVEAVDKRERVDLFVGLKIHC